MNVNYNGGGLTGCLHTYFKEKDMRVKAITIMASKLHKIETDKGTFVAKQFASQSKLNMQREFLSKLKKTGFKGAYTFAKNLEPIEWEKQNVGFLDYIPKSTATFTFTQYHNRMESLSLLTEMYKRSSIIINKLTYAPTAVSQIDKWRARLLDFQRYLPYLQKVIPFHVLKGYIRMGEWSLSKLETKELEDVGDPVIIHGDLAHHNFLRKADGELILIDFDLMAKAPPIIDYLQFANRILPYNDYSIEEILSYPQLTQYRFHQLFLAALSFPTDIYREWNRVAREYLWNSTYTIQTLLALTVKDYPKRLQFFHDIQKRI